MALYLDTHALIWYLSESNQLSEKANRAIGNEGSGLTTGESKLALMHLSPLLPA